jgi:hypothetical protein
MSAENSTALIPFEPSIGELAALGLYFPGGGRSPASSQRINLTTIRSFRQPPPAQGVDR